MLIEVVVSRPLPRWQSECIGHLSTVPGVELQLRAVPSAPAGQPWRWLANRCRMLAPSEQMPAGACSGKATPDGVGLVVDLVGVSPERAPPGSRIPIWRLVRADGLALSASYPFLDDWSQPDRIGTALLLDDRDRILAEAHLSTNGKGYVRILNEILSLAALLPVRAVRDHLNAVPVGSQRYDGTVAAKARHPVAGLLGGVLRFSAQRFLSLTTVEVWRIGLADQPISRFLEEAADPHVEWLTPREDAAYCADPFCNPDDPGEIWWERYDYHSPCGILERGRPQERDCREGVDLGVDGHLSYPYMTRVDDEIILIPEMSASGTTRLYRVDRDHSLETIASLPVPGIDPCLFRWQGRYWLGMTRADIDARSNFCLWHAPALSGPWTPHANNPVKIDVRSARNAGTPFWHAGCLYRPAQDCSQSYGGAVAINRIIECTPQTYREEVVSLIRPKPHWPARQGIHTVSSCGERTLIDAKTRVLSFSGLTSKFQKINKLWSRLGRQGSRRAGVAP